MDIEQFSLIVMQQVKQYVQPAIDALAKRIDEREAAIVALVEQKFAAVPQAIDAAQVRAVVAEAVAEIPPAKDGKDVDPEALSLLVETTVLSAMLAASKGADELLATQVAAAVSKIPVPQDGKSVNVDDVAPMIAEAIGKAVAAIPAPQDGASVTPEMMRPMLVEEVAKAVAALPAPKDGASVTLDDVTPMLAQLSVAAAIQPEDPRPLIDEAVAKAVALIPVPKDGQSVTIEQIQPLVDAAVKALPPAVNGKDAEPVDMAAVAEMVKEYVAAIPAPADGKSITLDDVRPMVTEFLAAIPAPKDGESVTMEQMTAQLNVVVESKQAAWELQFERRAQDRLQATLDRIPAPKDGAPGKDGRDALDLSDFDVEAKDSGRVLVFRLKRGDVVVEREVTTGIVIERGVHQSGKTYSAGDGCTWDGSFWIAQQDTDSKPGIDKTWRLAIKKGRDGKDGRNGIDKTAPVKLP